MAAEFEITDIDDSGGFITEHVSGADVFWHSHPEYEIMLNIDSAGTRIVGDSAEMFGSYDLVLIGDNLPHSWEYYRDSDNSGRERGVMIHFKLSSIGEALLAQHELQAVRNLLADSGRGIRFSVDDARLAEPHLENMLKTKGIEKMISFFNVLSIMCSSVKRKALCSETYKKAFDKRNNKRMTDVTEYVRNNFARPLTLEDASAVAKMSPFAFSRYFKKNAGEGFVEYLTRVRIEKARHLLRETGYNISDIADQCGFSSISNFNKHFRKSEGLSPRDYRSSFNKTQ